MKHILSKIQFLNEEIDPYGEEIWEDPNRNVVGYFVAKREDPKGYLENNNPKIHEKAANAIREMVYDYKVDPRNFDWTYGVYTLFDNGDVELTP
jgi:hypothetical protein